MNTKIIKEIDKRDEIPEFWDFKTANTKTYSHGYHSYPAMMIPQLVNEFLDIVMENNKITNVFDPFMGSGTTLVEGLVHGLDVIGTDLNPLSRMISKVKTTVIEPQKMEEHLLDWKFNFNYEVDIRDKKPTFKNVEFWFKDYVIQDLTIIQENINNIEDKNFKEFLLLAFSETIRDVSNTRGSEFKLYRMAKDTLAKWKPNVFEVMNSNLMKNIEGNHDLFNKIKENKNSIKILDNNVMNLKDIADSSFDLLITSPPYGDSRTTVAYGQFSRLSNQWLEAEGIAPEQVDNELLGGRIYKDIDIDFELNKLNSPTLQTTVLKLKEKNEKRAKEVFQFFFDLNKGLKEITRVMKEDSYQFWVVGNRTVLKSQIETHKIIIELFENLGVELVTYFTRGIPRKKMPSLNSPTNEKGKKVTTMNNEIIIVLRKKK